MILEPDDPLAAALRRLVPDRAIVSAMRGDSELPMAPDEAAAVAAAVPKRRREFSRGRACAHDALGALGFYGASVPVGDHRQPVWPAGVTGSITHCADLAAAVVAPVEAVAGIGLDAEPDRPLPEQTRGLILHPSEESADRAAEVVVFSAKESIHKALFPLSGVWMEFLDVELELDPARSRFSARPAPGAGATAPRLTELVGRYTVAGGFVLTACWLE